MKMEKNNIKPICKIICSMLLLCIALPLSAVDYTYSQNSGSKNIIFTSAGDNNKFKVDGTEYDNIGTDGITVSGGTLDLVFNTSGIVQCKGPITVTGGTLNIYLGEYYTATGSTLKRANENVNAPLIKVTGGILNINGKKTNDKITYFFLHGGSEYRERQGDNTSKYTAANDGIKSQNELLLFQSGTVNMKYVNIAYNWNSKGNGGAIKVETAKNTESKVILEMDDCIIKSCYAYRSGSAMYINGSSNLESSITMNNCQTLDCFCQAGNDNDGGTYRTVGTSNCTLKMEDCTIKRNTSYKTGGGISWNAGTVEPLELTRCTFSENWTDGIGGALTLGSSATIKSCKISDNYSTASGGGISYSTYGSASDIQGFMPYFGTITLDAETVISGNTAKNYGGAILFEVKPLNINKGNDGVWTVFTGINPDTKEEGQYEESLIIDGAQIYGNTSASASAGGGAIAIMRRTNIYKSDLKISSGKIHDNIAKANGGAIYVNCNNNSPVYGSMPSGYSTLPMSVILGEEAGTDLLEIYKNQAGNGGAMYMDGSGFSTTMYSGEIGGEDNGNEATGNGGGIYTKGGDLTIKGGTIAGNIAKAGTGTGTGLGGGIYVSGGGNVVMDGGTIKGNTSVDGGGAYVDAGTTDFQSGDISDNTATGNGGGVYVAGGTVAFSGNLKGNIAMNGGGLYLASQATMTFKGGIISGNSAVVRSKSDIASTAYNSGNGTGNVEGCGGGIYLDSGAEGYVTSLNFNLSGTSSFGLYSNLAEKGGDDLVSEGRFTSIVLPDVSKMSLAGFEGKDANPDWYEDYFTEDTSYEEGTNVRDVSKRRYRELLKEANDESSHHRIPLGTGEGKKTPESIADKYLCLTLGYQSLKFTLKVTGLVGEECAKFLLRRHGAEGNYTDYDLLFSADDDAENPGTSTKKFANMAWGDYSILPVEGWNWAYDPVTPVVNIHIANTWEYEHTFEMKHKNNSQIPLHEEHNVAL